MTITNLVCGASVGLGLLLGAGACTRRQSHAAPAVATAPAPGPSAVSHAEADGVAPPQSSPCGAFTHEGQASEFHHGVLTYREPPRVMSVDAYRHVEFSLHTRERKLALATSPSVAWEQLHRARDRELSVLRVDGRADAHCERGRAYRARRSTTGSSSALCGSVAHRRPALTNVGPLRHPLVLVAFSAWHLRPAILDSKARVATRLRRVGERPVTYGCPVLPLRECQRSWL